MNIKMDTLVLSAVISSLGIAAYYWPPMLLFILGTAGAYYLIEKNK